MKLTEVAFIVAVWKILQQPVFHMCQQAPIRNKLSLHCTHLDMVEIVSCQSSSACQPRAMEWVFDAAFHIDDIEASSKFRLDLYSNGSMQGAKEQASEAISRLGGDESTT